MATRIPAWRRLGLALQSEAQSGVAVPAPTTSHGGENQSVATPEAVKATQASSDPSIESAQDGKSLKLGKRKHQHDAAEENEPMSAKKSRTAAEKTNGQEEAATEALVVSQDADALPSSTTEELSSGTPAKSGDPNYRQGKKKKPKLTPKDRKKLAQQKAQEEFPPSPAETVPVKTRATLLASTEIDHSPARSFSTPQKHQPILRDRSKDSSGSPPRTDRRKSVAFTPDTKRVDGDSGQTWFKKWAAEQKGEDTEAIAQPSFNPAPAVVDEPKEATKLEKKDKRAKKDKTLAKEKEAAAFAASAAAKEEQGAEDPIARSTDAPKDSKKQPLAAKGKKKDPSIYISYLTQYYNDRENWKFNKAKQNDVVDNALNIFRIPDEHSQALLEYIKGLKGAGVVDRLKEKTLATIKDLDAEDAKAPAAMDADAHKAAKEAALKERVAKEKKRRKVDGDVAELAGHPDGDAYIRRMRRSRAEALLSALGRTAPILPAPKPTTSTNSPPVQNLAPQDRARKRKRRTDISSDESSSDSSSDDSSSDDSDSDSDDSADSDSNSASASEGDSSSEDDKSDESRSDSDSD